MNRMSWDRLLTEIRSVHENTTALQTFCPFPDDIRQQQVLPHHIPSSDLMQADPALESTRYRACCQALIDCADQAHWRETYKGTDIGEDFLNRFGCYGIIGPNAPFHSDRMRAWVVYMPARLWYPWHHHPAEEMYLTLAGTARFLVRGHPDQTMIEGTLSTHMSDQPHATETTGSPFLAYVVWRNQFEIAPVLTPAEKLE
ncbi:dimethylsulfonioproprionate lyase family protein [Primorskyibacter sp. S87]|uniref:dimethylsulfonioproprionate lyase family protein n=1 Tax=Primorskyibacter sp. S87 TaxID=3415126 RepID=UPI003C7DF37C